MGHYVTLCDLFVSMLEFVSVQNTNKTYYEYRRNIYVFRNSYLAYLLHFAVSYTKIIFGYFDNSPTLH